jgi:C-terminal processing protease CtpA/Prc
MPKDLRFCRNCGFRLGEGAAEYTETVRFQNAPSGFANVNSASTPGAYIGPTAIGRPQSRGLVQKCRRLGGTTWLFVILIVFFVAAGAFSSLIRRVRPQFPPVISINAARSYAGVNSFDSADAGATFANVDPPGGPADLAGLVGGDIITKADGQKIDDEDDIANVLSNTPIGKTIEIEYLRDGESHVTKLTTMSKAEVDHLARAYRDRPEGKGRFGFNNNATERVPVEGTKMFGVRLDSIEPSLPADMAGIKEGDIVIEFDGVPIRTPEELTARVRRAIPYETVTVVLMRAGQKLELPVKMGKQ